MRLAIIILAALAIAWATAGIVTAQGMICVPVEYVRAGLRSTASEEKIGEGIGSGGGYIVEVWASAGGATFSVVYVYPDGIGCLAATVSF